MDETTLHQYKSLQLALFSGKGGVGKTTLSCGFARQWAQQFPQERILLLSTDPAHSLGDVLQMAVGDVPVAMATLPNLQVRSLDARSLLETFKNRYGSVLELLAERGSFAQREDLAPVWDLSFPGLDELMGILEIQRLLHDAEADRVVVDMAPSGHTLNLFGLMDFLDELLAALELFQEKHRAMQRSFTGKETADEADDFLRSMKAELTDGRQLLQDTTRTACLVVAIAEPMSLLESDRFITALAELQIPFSGLFINRILPLSDIPHSSSDLDRFAEQQTLLAKFFALVDPTPIFTTPQQRQEPIGATALDALITQLQPLTEPPVVAAPPPLWMPTKVSPGFADFVAEERKLILVGGKGGVGKTTVAAAIAWGMAERYPDRQIRVISIDPAHSLGDAVGQPLGHAPSAIAPNLTGQEIDAEQMLDQFRAEYLWELAAMMSGESSDGDTTLKIAYTPEAWRKIVAQALPGIDEMLSLIRIIELLEAKTQDLIILDTAPTGHLLRFLEMPTAMADWLSWIFKLWIKYQDVLGRTEFMGRLRSLRQRVMQAQKLLKNPQHTEFIGVVQAQSAITAEAQRLTDSLTTLGIFQRYIVHNRHEANQPAIAALFPQQTIVALPNLPRCISPLERVQLAATLIV
ncbi:ArsA family ATPase [Phormidium sp. CLA17]|uniref:ArsA family ATPase n=1 Tax=Leptolyngbya sp. Cla-17 TaxID=2803751 RepID=UPI0014912293|nr:ArsA family ATPase [Leptolyngbya sp. Cla-17]MBM0740515.1 ArsA family ATPase [Leptolyngbya sp. Cla-17]